MRKSLGKRLISGVTAALTAVSLFPNVLPNSMAAGETSDINSAKTASVTEDKTKFNVNTFGYVGALKLDSETMPNFNWGVSYNRLMHFDRRYRGVGELNTSITNYLADKMMAKGIVADDILIDDPIANSNADWNQVLAFNNYLVIPTNHAGTRR